MPGTTTYLELDRVVPAGVIGWWTIDGRDPTGFPPGVPGVDGAGSTDESPPLQRPWRAMVAPGSHVIRIVLSDRELQRTITIAKGERLVVRAE